MGFEAKKISQLRWKPSLTVGCPEEKFVGKGYKDTNITQKIVILRMFPISYASVRYGSPRIIGQLRLDIDDST